MFFKSITNSTRFRDRNVLVGMNYRVDIDWGERGTKKAGFICRTCCLTSENRDSDLAKICHSGPTHFEKYLEIT